QEVTKIGIYPWVKLTPLIFFPIFSSANASTSDPIGKNESPYDLDKIDVPRENIKRWFEESSKNTVKISLYDNVKEIGISKYTDYIEDRTGSTDINTIISSSYGTINWKPYRTEKIPSFGYTNSVYWVKYLIENESDLRDQYFLELAYNHHSYVDFHIIYPDGKNMTVKTGNFLPYAKRIFDYHNFVFPMQIPKKSSIFVILRSQSVRSMLFPVTIWNPDYFHAIKSRELTVFGFYYGMLAVMILYNIFLFVSIRDKAYIIYSLYVISYFIFQASMNGLSYKHFWPENVYLGNFAVYIGLSFNSLLLAIFAQVFLQTGKRQPFFHRLISFILYPGAFIGIILSLTSSKSIGPYGNGLSLVTVLLLAITGISSLIKGYRPARYYVFAFSTIFIGIALLALRNVGILPSNAFTEYGVQIGSAAEIVLLSFALGDKIQIEQKQAQEDIEALNNSLELKVDEKTTELKEANQKLLEIDKLKTRFFQNVSHELRTPLTLILNPIEIAQADYPSDRNISSVYKNSKRLLRLVNQLLDFQKYSIAGSRIELGPVNLTDLVISIADYFVETAKKRNISFSLKINDSYNDEVIHQKIFVKGHIDALEKIIFNYLSNALKYVKENGNIILRLQKIENKAVISVTDNGIGISMENQKKLFKLFSQVDESSSRPYEGTGLGLALTKELAEKMNGTVEVTSTVGEGSCFLATFPIYTVEKPTIDLLSIIGDSEFQEKLLHIAKLNSHFSSINSYNDLFEAKSFCTMHRILNLIIDESMLGKYGNKALREICECNENMNIFILKSSDNTECLKELREFDIFPEELKAPWNPEEIIHNLSKNIAAKSNKSHSYSHNVKEWLLADADADYSKMEKDIMENMAEADSCISGSHILVVDDNIDMIHLISSYLKNEKFHLSIALNGRDALSKCQKLKPDLIITDWMMPVMSGPELIQQLKTNRAFASIPVILLTAKSDEISKKEGTHYGADAFLGKPFDHLELVSMIGNLLKLKEGEKQIALLNQEISSGVLRRFLPQELINGILNGEEIFENKPKISRITILIVTLTGIKNAIKEMYPDHISRLLNDYYLEITKIIFSNRGVIDRFEDGSVRALFGALSSASPDVLVQDACNSALEIEKKVCGMIPDWNKRYDCSLSYRMAIHYGEALVGMIGSPLRTDFTAIGSTVHFAQYLDTLANDHEIIISREARDHIDPDMWVNRDDPNISDNKNDHVLSRLINSNLERKKAV
ncbi:MAG: response regulator, partial [Oligoflexales bacterium]|nr:response regulator [Oligoflexales bacterium]